jgi:hypothetical protein
MNNYQLNRTERLKKANEHYYITNYNLNYDKYHTDYKRDRLIINKIMNKPFNLEILMIILKFKKQTELYEAMNEIFTDEDYDKMKSFRELTKQQNELNEELEKLKV